MANYAPLSFLEPNTMKLNKISAILCAVFPALSFAETATLPDIKVYSASATTLTQDQTASSVTVLTEKDFAERNATYVSDVLKTVPSVAIASSGGRGTLTNVYLRGAETNQTVVIIDGVKMNPVTGSGYDFGGLSLSNIERIEVLRGEQSALWGSDAMGGVIYITTKSGLYKDKPFNVDFDLGTGSNGTYSGSTTISGYSNGFYYALSGSSYSTKGISAVSKDKFSYTSESGETKTTSGAVERDKFHKDNVSLRLGYDKNDKGIELLVSQSSQTAHYDNPYSMTTETTIDEKARNRENVVKLSGYIGSDQELFKNKVSLSQIKTKIDRFGANPSAYDAKKLNANYQLDVNFDREGSVTQGLSFLGEYQRANYEGSEYNNVLKKLVDKSIAAEYRLLTDTDHAFSLSGRYIDNSFYGDALTVRASGAYRLSPNFRVHGSIGTATQTPTMDEYFGYAPWQQPNFDLKPEKSFGGDVGLLVESTDKKHSLDITYFARNVKNFIAYNNNWTQMINLDGTTKVKGIELAYNGQLSEKLSSYANYTYTRAKDAKHLELIRRPKHAANVGLSYQITEQLGSSVSISYVGKRIDSGRYKMPSYTLANLGVNYQINKHINVYANLNNVFNKKYENLVGYGQDGRNVYVGLKGSF